MLNVVSGEKKMKLIPQPQKVSLSAGNFNLSGITEINIEENCDFRVIGLIEKLCDELSSVTNNRITVTNTKASQNGISVYHGDSGESYSLNVSKVGIIINGTGPAGAFYGIQTLRQMIHEYKTKIPFCNIEDKPYFKMRGFYHDVTRGRVPKLENLHKIVDEMGYYKLNSLQLYIEDAFDFEEYKDIIADDDKLFADEIRELDEYCYNNFIELIPSLSTFGHLYNLLQSEKYKHLCELDNYVPTQHYWLEKMQHHTIDFSNSESLKLIFSLIDQYVPLFRSNYFNICCDETMDLCLGKNRGKDVSKAYYDFVGKIASHLKSKGKTVMMWADIAIKYSGAL